MKTPHSLAFLFLSAIALATSIAQPATARPTVPITNIAAYIGSEDGYILAYLSVPDKDTTVLHPGGNGLRHYDIHIAKMFEITHYECLDNQRRGNPMVGLEWNYQANNGKIDMGDFRISCSLAQDIVDAYGLGEPETTEILYYRAQNTVDFPTLDLYGSKAQRWQEFTTNFTPE